MLPEVGRRRPERRPKRTRRAAAWAIRATDSARAHTGGGTVFETETGDDGAAYSVEVQLADGSQVEVNLDESFDVIGSEPDDDGAGDDEGPADDD